MTEVRIFILLKVITVRFISPDVTSSSQLYLPVKQQISNNNSWTLCYHTCYTCLYSSLRMEHGYSLPRPSADAVPQKRKRTWEANDPRRLRHKKRGKTRVNTGVAFPKWREL